MPPIMEGYHDDLYAQWNDPWANQQQQQQQPQQRKNQNKQHHSWRQQLTSADRSDPYVFPQHQTAYEPQQLPQQRSHLQQHQHATGYYDSYYVSNNFSSG